MPNLDQIQIDDTTYDIKDSGAYNKPSGGIPKTDLASAVQTSLDGAIQAPSSPVSGAFLVWNGTAWVAQTLNKTWFGSITDEYDELSGEGYNSTIGGFARTVTTSTGDFTLTDKNTLVIRSVVFSGQYKHFINVDSTGYKEILLSASTHLMNGKTETYVLGDVEVAYNSTADAYMVTNGWSFKKPDEKATVSEYGNVQIGYNFDPAGGWVRIMGGDKVLYAPGLLVSNAGTSPSTPSSETIRAKWLPDATSSTKGAVLLKSSITAGDTNAVNSVAVIDYIASLDGSNISY